MPALQQAHQAQNECHNEEAHDQDEDNGKPICLDAETASWTLTGNLSQIEEVPVSKYRQIHWLVCRWLHYGASVPPHCIESIDEVENFDQKPTPRLPRFSSWWKHQVVSD